MILFILLIFLHNIVCSTNDSIKAKPLTPENCVIAFDLDDTLIEYTTFYKIKIATFGVSLLAPFKSLKYLRALNVMRKIKKEQTSKKQKGNLDTSWPALIGGAFLQLTYAGLQEPELREYVPGLIQLVWENTVFKEGALELLRYLHKQGYQIWIATNKDHVSYQQVVDALDKTYECKVSTLINDAFVVWPQQTYLEQHYKPIDEISPSFNEMIQQVFTVTPTDHIHHSAQEKPNAEYYKEMLTFADSKVIVFFDDMQKNIDGAKRAGIAKSYRIKSVLDIIKQLKRLNIISEESEDSLYREMYQESLVHKEALMDM